jgi:hypothetical protein
MQPGRRISATATNLQNFTHQAFPEQLRQRRKKINYTPQDGAAKVEVGVVIPFF